MRDIKKMLKKLTISPTPAEDTFVGPPKILKPPEWPTLVDSQQIVEHAKMKGVEAFPPTGNE